MFGLAEPQLDMQKFGRNNKKINKIKKQIRT